MMNCRSSGRAFTITLTLCVLSSFAAYALWRHNPDVVLENHIIEWTQAGLLMLACLIHLGRGRVDPDGSARQVRYGLALLCLSLFMREVDIHTLSKEEVMHPVENVLRGMLVVVWIIYVIGLRHHVDGLHEHRWRIALSKAVVFTLGGCVLYAASWPFDKRIAPIDAGMSRFVEELVQMNATILFAAGSMSAVLRQRRADGATARPGAGSGQTDA